MSSERRDEKFDVDAVKNWLLEYRTNERDLDNQNERLERLISKITSVGAQTLSDMPKAHSERTDRFGDYIAKKEELEQDIAKSVQRQREQREQIEHVLSHLHNANERAVIRVRYLDVSSWNDVVDLIFGGKPDFVDKEESYLRSTHKIHGNALLHMAMYIAQKDDAQ